ncbi:hypothetical protein ABZT04_41125 [Streptomyces sp. NPDC005492]|uniref:hypothetical protein n=1 Tax=Streptomyces sp. NPDC005492 TaxID=3156883 RepID=UPI0033BDF7DA
MKRIDGLSMVNNRLTARRTQAVAIGVLCASALVGCSKDNGYQPQKRATAASVCDGAFDEQAAQALRSLSGATRFQEVKRKSISGTFTQLVKDLNAIADDSDADLGEYLCQFTAVGKKTGSPIQVGFSWVAAKGDGSSAATESSEAATAYTFARSTKSTDNYAWVSFPCARDQGDQGLPQPSYLTATVNTYPPGTTDSAKSAAYREANIRMAYSAAVKAASTIGCFKESGLPKTLGALKARPVTAG